ncbi:hypothetical protein [Bradyrhizobium sp. McL0616]|uniref:hypothetical protein n=1 Tax=Bradyrhizobium sp. McL0616 TaxID=3415674 RepID=UPI003CFB9B48
MGRYGRSQVLFDVNLGIPWRGRVAVLGRNGAGKTTLMKTIGRAMLGDPKLLLLDEPTEGVWIGVIEEITERLIELAKNIAVIIVEQHLDLALRVADYAYVLDRGRVALQGAAEEVRSSPDLLRYLAP